MSFRLLLLSTKNLIPHSCRSSVYKKLFVKHVSIGKAYIFLSLYLITYNANFQIIACAIGIGVIVHAGNHMACDFPRLVNSSPEKFALIASDFNNRKPSYKSLLTGVEGITGISMVILLIIAFTLATRHLRKNVVKLPAPFNRLTGFNAFWFSHHLTCLVYILLLIHGNFLYFAHKWYQKTVRTLI